jgi:hypothetical protein
MIFGAGFFGSRLEQLALGSPPQSTRELPISAPGKAGAILPVQDRSK